MLKRPSVNAAALENTSAPPSASLVASASGIGELRQTESAYDGLPGPAKTKSAVRRRESAAASASGARWLWSTASGPRNPEASIVSCTRCAKYSTARSVISDAFSWNPYGVSSKHRARRRLAQARDDLAVRRDHRRRGLAGAHDREDARRARAHVEESFAERLQKDLGDTLGKLEVQVVVAGREPDRADLAAGRERRGFGACACGYVLEPSPLSASSSKVGAFSVAQRVEGRCSQSERRIER